jgi:outer membrane protein assembly factor BamB
MNARVLLVLAAGLCAPALAARADDWPQWRGPDRSGVSKETGLLETWPKGGPKLLWTYRDAGLGYSHPAVVGDRLYLTGGRGDSEYLFALGVKDGKEIWSAKLGPLFTFQGNAWGDGPRSAPSVDGELVYALGGFGAFVCVRAGDGHEVWRKDLPKDLQAEVNPIGGGPENLGWGYTWSPLVDGDQVICVPGGPEGLLAALDKKTGKVLWRSGQVKEKAPYSSPMVATVGGVRHYVQMTYKGAVGVAAKDGKLLWSYQRKPGYKDVLIPTPLVHDNFVFLTQGMGLPAVGCDLIRLTPGDSGEVKVAKVYQNKELADVLGGVVLVGGHVYGSSGGLVNSPRMRWVCLDFQTGKVAWSDDQDLDEPGSVIAADGHLYCYGQETGTAVLLEASPEKWTEKGRFEIPEKTKHQAPSGKVWTHPVIANGRLYLRDQELLFCYNIKE